MAPLLSRVSYCTREDVKTALDLFETARGNSRIDRALRSVSELIEQELKRVFYPNDTTRIWDWPNFQYAEPWRVHFGQWDLAATPTAVQSPPGTTLNVSQIFFGPWNKLPDWPFTFMELDRSQNISWGVGPTPQRSIQVTGTWGFTNATDPAGTLAVAMSDTTGTVAQVSNAALLGVGDLMIVDSERMLVQERAAVTTGQTNVSGITTASTADVTCTVSSGAAVSIGEVLLIDSERLLVEDITGNNLIVKRAFDGTVLATHSAATTLYAYRSLTVARGQYGTAAATHLISAPVSRHRPPGLVRDLCIAECLNRVLQEGGGYNRQVSEGQAAHPMPGVGLADLWDEAVTAFGRKARVGAI